MLLSVLSVSRVLSVLSVSRVLSVMSELQDISLLSVPLILPELLETPEVSILHQYLQGNF